MIDFGLFFISIGGGLLSFLAPCNIGTLPAFIAYIQGQTNSTKKAILMSLVFSIGFIAVFTIIASIFIVISGFIQYIFWIKMISGIVIIVMAFYLFFSKFSKKEPQNYKPTQVEAETLKNVYGIKHDKKERKEHQGILGALILGFSMGSPWIACITPIYLSIVTIAMNQETFILGFLLFSFYALGLMIPYILIGTALGLINQRVIVKFIKISSWLQKIFAILLIWIGTEFLLSAFGIGGLLPYI